MNTEAIQDYQRLTAKQRYHDFISQVRKQQQLWTLADEQGCLIIDTEKEKVLLLWPESALAAHWAEKDHPGFKPLAIELTAFTDKWLPGMDKDGFDLAIAPSFAGEGTIVSPAELQQELCSGKIK